MWAALDPITREVLITAETISGLDTVKWYEDHPDYIDPHPFLGFPIVEI